MVPGAGLEPARCCHRGILSPLFNRFILQLMHLLPKRISESWQTVTRTL